MNENKKHYCIVSGGFDPIHEGHINLIKEAKKKSDGVILLLNSDQWLCRKKGKNFQSFETRKSICQSIVGVIEVFAFDDSDDSADHGIKTVRNKYKNYMLSFANGGDRTANNIREEKICESCNVSLLFGIGGDYKANSSSDILQKWADLYAKPEKHKKTAIITGVTGQDGSYLAEFLLEKGYYVVGIKRRTSLFNTGRIDHLLDNPKFNMYYGDLTDSSSLIKIVSQVKPDEIYNLAAQSHVKVSWDCPEYTAETDGVGVLRLLEAVVINNFTKHTKFYQASTSELYGLIQETPQTERTPFYPRSPYAVAKLYGHWITINYRESHGMYACSGILFNHESPRRGETFVTRKITRAASRIKLGVLDKLSLGNLNACRDWGHTRDYIEGMWLMLQQKVPKDYVLATGVTVSVRDFCTKVFKYLGFDIFWQGSGLNEKGIDKNSGKILIDIDPEYFRPAEVELLLGDASKARKELGWSPKISLDDLITEMVDSDLKDVKIQLSSGDISGSE